MIKRIYIDGYKSFKNFEVELQPLSVIFGPNGSGKSNLIDAIKLISALCTSKNITDAFKEHRGDALESFNYGNVGFDENMKKDNLEMTFEVDVELSESSLNKAKEIINNEHPVWGKVSSKRLEKYLRYKIQISATPETGYINFIDDELIALDVRGNIKKDQEDLIANTFLSISTSEEDPVNQGYNHKIDKWKPFSRISKAENIAIYPSAYAFRLEVEKWRTYYLNPEAIRKYQPVKDVRFLALDGSDIAPFLNVLRDQKPNAYNNLIKTIRIILPQKPDIIIDRPKPGSLALKIEENGISYSADLISDGTLRVLGFLAAFRPENNSTLVAFEEPEDGVHPVRLSQLADVINNMADTGLFQIIITTHSPILPKYFENNNLFVCGKDGKSTIIKPFISLGKQYKDYEILENLDDRILRGDFGG